MTGVISGNVIYNSTVTSSNIGSCAYYYWKGGAVSQCTFSGGRPVWSGGSALPAACDAFRPSYTVHNPDGTTSVIAGTGIVCSSDVADNVTCKWCECLWMLQIDSYGTGNWESFRPCGPNSWCDCTGLRCDDAPTFRDNDYLLFATGATPETRGGFCRTGTIINYEFVGCTSGTYDNSNCPSGYTVTGWSGLAHCCSWCSGLNNYIPGVVGSSSVITINDDGGLGRATGGTGSGVVPGTYSWNTMSGLTVPDGNGGYRPATGIETCVGYLPQSSYTDAKGTYTVDFCTYEN